MISYCTEYLSGIIQFASPNIAKIGSNYLLQFGAPILLIVGLVFCIEGLTEKNSEDK